MGTSNNGHGTVWSIKEAERLNKQAVFENESKIQTRKEKGQFFTDFEVAEELVHYGMTLVKGNGITCLEPAFGSGSFFSAIEKKYNQKVAKVLGYEIDRDLFEKVQNIWRQSNRLNLINNDFFKVVVDEKVDFLITNPPYVRHQYIDADRKKEYSDLIYYETGIRLSGLSGLYCHYLLHGHQWLKPGAIAGWLLPSEFMDVNYGKEIKDFLLNNVTLLRIHRYDPAEVIFNDVQVTSAVVWYRNTPPNKDYSVEFSYGGTHNKPLVTKKIKQSVLINEKKWTRFPQKEQRVVNNNKTIGDYFEVKRGLATGDNDFFIIDKEKIKKNGFKMDYLQPILPSPKYLSADEIEADENGMPTNITPLYLINCRLNECEIQKLYPELWVYLEKGVDSAGKSYLCKSRKKWYYQEQRQAAPILCKYMGRGNKSIRFVRNKSDAVATNSYLMLYPNACLTSIISNSEKTFDYICQILNNIATEIIDEEGRIYGGGLKKIEPKELKNVKLSNIEKFM